MRREYESESWPWGPGISWQAKNQVRYPYSRFVEYMIHVYSTLLHVFVWVVTPVLLKKKKKKKGKREREPEMMVFLLSLWVCVEQTLYSQHQYPNR